MAHYTKVEIISVLAEVLEFAEATSVEIGDFPDYIHRARQIVSDYKENVDMYRAYDGTVTYGERNHQCADCDGTVRDSMCERCSHCDDAPVSPPNGS